MPIVDANRLKGNNAAAVVAARLSADCLVRPVSADTDVGIDLYCETVEGQESSREPFLHFWVQVRGGAQCRLTDGGAAASCSFDKNHLEYWFRQPVPVFAALVPDAGWHASTPTIYVIPVSTLLLYGISALGQSVSLQSEFVWAFDDRRSLQIFLTEIVPAATAQLDCRKGLVAAIPQLSPGYIRTTPPIPVARFQDEITQQIRSTAARSILQLHLQRALGGKMAPFRRRMEGLLTQYVDDGHWETHMARGLASHADGRYSEAVVFYQAAAASIKGDPNVSGLPDWQACVAWIESMIHKATRQDPVDAG